MKKRCLSLVLAAAMVASLVGCGSGSSSKEKETTGEAGTQTESTENAQAPTESDFAEDGSVYHVLYSSEVATMNYLITATQNEQRVGANAIDTLVEYDNEGNLQASLATDWSYDEATLTWTFTLREGQKWVDKTGAEVADVTAQDFVDAMQYILTPEYGSSVAQSLFGIIANAEEYYNGLAGEGDVIDFAEVGVKAIDEKTLQYTLATEVPYFLSMLTYVCFMPAYGPLLEAQGANFGTSADSMYYCGAYYLSSYEPQVGYTLTKNNSNWDADKVYIGALEYVYNAEEGTIGAEMAKRGEIDFTTLGSDVAAAWLADAETANMVSMQRPAIDYSYFYCFNFNVKALNEDFYRDGMTGYSIADEYEPWNWELAVNNENFRKSFMYGISRIATVAVETGDYADPATYMMNTITPKGFSANNGVDYTEDAAFASFNADGYDFFDQDAALSYKAAAMEELTAQGCTFPVKVLVRYNPSTPDWEDQCVVLEQQLEAVLGTDYVDLIVEAGPSDSFLTAVRRSCDYMFMLCNWGADYADPETYTDPFYQSLNDDGTYHRGMRYAYMAYAITDNTASADTVKEYFNLVEAAKAITNDTTARYAAFAKAEAYLIEHALVVPYGVSVSDFVVSKVNPWEAQYAAFGVSVLRFKGQHLLNDFYSMSQYEAEAAKH